MSHKHFKYSTSVAAVLAAAIVVCRFNRQAADFYALHIYPAVSAALSFVSSVLPFSFNDTAIAVLIVAAAVILLSAVFGRRRWLACLGKELKLALWVFVWFYIGWCTNYYRSDIFIRTGTARSAYDEQVFTHFLDEYTCALNESYVDFDGMPDCEADVKDFYGRVPSRYGLCAPRPWQHTKPMLVHRIQSAVGVTGYMGPLGGEFHINSDVLPANYPFTYAHEYAHLLGVSSEAEANWWAYQACRTSDDPRIRFSAYYSILGHVWNNARKLLDENAFKEWRNTVTPEIVDALMAESEYWDEKRIQVLDKAQTFIYDLFLKANQVPSGIKNYSEVIQMIISLDEAGS